MFERLHGQNQETRHSLDQSGPEGTKNEAQWHKGRKKFLIAIWDSEIIKTQEKEKKTKTYIYLTCFLRELKERGSNSEAEQHSKDGKLQQLAWLAPHNPCNPILGQLPNR